VTYTEAETFLFTLPRFAVSGAEAYIPGLDRIDSVLNAMGRPQDSFDSILVAGTNGKGSTASMIAAIASAGSYKTGLHTSPHLQFFGERMRVNGVPADQAWISNATERYRDVIQNAGASFFEASVALSFLHFAENDVDLAVVEVGLGGRLDATKILTQELTVITNVALDHVDILGSTLADIASEKGGIMRAGTPTLVGTTDPSVNMVLGDMADEIGSEFHMLSAEIDLCETPEEGLVIETMRERYGPMEIPLEGAHHVVHASLAIRASELISKKFPLMRPHAVQGIASVVSRSGLRGRMELITRNPNIWLDVAHNPQAIAGALEIRTGGVTRTSGESVSNIMIGLMADKDIEGIAKLLALAQTDVTVLGIDNSRAVPPKKLAAIFEKLGVHVSDVFISTAEALSALMEAQTEALVDESDGQESGGVLIIGSHMIVSEALDWWAKNQGDSQNPC